MEDKSNINVSSDSISISSTDNKKLEMIMEQKSKNFSTVNKLNSLKEGYLPNISQFSGKRDSTCDRKVSVDFEIKTDQNSMNVEVDDPDYMNFDPTEDANGNNNNFDFEIKEDLASDKKMKDENDIYANIVINENIN